ncbi:MAG: cytoplasmic protein [Tenericutes bacterium HGW-Tenericutes-1]|jgi:hypothetical protein|nr:MAG: cytoplasmic protein [Tenericutes bacterium HGW-Tenericutes-1]PKM95778.1 MAG: cytoplasmic protein [Firmicutes bacterium HGW-Firmicutes-1]
MGLLDSLMGNASQVDNKIVEKELSPLLANGETILKAFAVFRDMFIFTNKRLILADKQGLTGSKVEYHSIPYKSITHFAVETAGTFDNDSELKIWISGNSTPIQKEFKKNTNIKDVQTMLANCIFN